MGSPWGWGGKSLQRGGVCTGQLGVSGGGVCPWGRRESVGQRGDPWGSGGSVGEICGAGRGSTGHGGGGLWGREGPWVGVWGADPRPSPSAPSACPAPKAPPGRCGCRRTRAPAMSTVSRPPPAPPLQAPPPHAPDPPITPPGRLLLPEKNLDAFFVSPRGPSELQRRPVHLKLGEQVGSPSPVSVSPRPLPVSVRPPACP